MFELKIKNKIQYLQSDIFSSGLIHAFSTRIGGETPFPLDAFSMSSAGVEKDNPEISQYIEKNRKDLCKVFNLSYERLLVPQQKHTDNIKIVKKFENIDLSNTDGVVTNVSDLPIMLLFADCTPIILYNKTNSVIGVIHAGWRGSAKQIVKKAVKIFKDEFSIKPENIEAAIGPAIGSCCYPVSKEVAKQLNMSIESGCDNIFFEDGEKIKVDLKRLNEQQLKESGLIEIDTTDFCTSCQNDLFYSYRAENGSTGRHCAIACLKEGEK